MNELVGLSVTGRRAPHPPRIVMATNCSSSSAAGFLAFASAIISAYTEDAIPVLTLVLLYAVLGATCLSLLFAVFYFSTREPAARSFSRGSSSTFFKVKS
jgi:hypothetical protein